MTLKNRILERIMTMSQDDENFKIVTTDVPGAPEPSNFGQRMIPAPMPQQFCYPQQVVISQGKRILKLKQSAEGSWAKYEEMTS